VHGLGQQVVLASSASKEELDHYLELLDAQAMVVATTSSDDVKKTKPAPDIFATALDKLPGIDADQVIVVGDTPYDMLAANKCGIAAVALRSGGFSDDTLWNAGAIGIYDDAEALLAGYADSPLGR
jgi:phosphoglycolate phosphatase-like HAD superfamily hydrolase